MGVGVVLAAAGLLFALSAETARGTQLRSDRGDLASLITAENARVNGRARQVADLHALVDQQTKIMATGDQQVSRLQARAEPLVEAAGLAPVEGPGVAVTLDDAPRDKPVPAGVKPDDIVVHQQDVQAVVNALWAGGAEAMMLQDQRVISTSAVRCVGNTLILQGRVYSPPYTVTAIGDPARLRAALGRSPEVVIYQQYVAALGLGWSVKDDSNLKLPQFEGSLALRFARVP